MSDSWLTLENHAGDPLQAGELELIPVSQAARLQLAGLHLMWNRPVSVIVRREDGQQTILPVHDYTRRAQLTLLGAGLLGACLAWLGFGRRRRSG